VKCGEEHPTGTCEKSAQVPAKCANCQGEHPVSYKGCSKYKEYRTQILEPLRQKQPRKKEEQQPPTNINLEQSVPKLTQINRPQSLTKTTQFSAPQHKNATYAEIVKHKEKSNADRAEMPDLTLLINAMFERIENLVKRLLERTMDRMIQLIGHVLHSQK